MACSGNSYFSVAEYKMYMSLKRQAESLGMALGWRGTSPHERERHWKQDAGDGKTGRARLGEVSLRVYRVLS